MGTILFAATNDIVTSVSIRALFGGFIVLLLALPLLAVLKPQKYLRQMLYFIIIGIILLTSSVIFSATLAHINNEPKFSMQGLTYDS